MWHLIYNCVCTLVDADALPMPPNKVSSATKQSLVLSSSSQNNLPPACNPHCSPSQQFPSTSQMHRSARSNSPSPPLRSNNNRLTRSCSRSLHRSEKSISLSVSRPPSTRSRSPLSLSVSNTSRHLIQPLSRSQKN